VKRLGPEIKLSNLSSLKVPAVVEDLYQDLRDRRLLPLVALIVIAIVAVPFLLGGASDEEEAVPATEVPREAATSSATEASLSVVQADPGLRDYRKRLSHRQATDPFKPHYTGPVLAGTQLNGAPETTAVTSTTTTESSGSATAEPAPAPSSGSSDGSSGGAPPGAVGDSGKGAGGDSAAGEQLTLYSYAIDVTITKTTTKPNGEKAKPEVIEKERVLPPTALPGEKTQVVTYMGISPKTQKPLFLVSTDVTAVFGDAKCIAGSESCQLLELETKIPEIFVYGENGARYKLTVLNVEPVATGHS
jgi:hypothetical protein